MLGRKEHLLVPLKQRQHLIQVWLFHTGREVGEEDGPGLHRLNICFLDCCQVGVDTSKQLDLRELRLQMMVVRCYESARKGFVKNCETNQILVGIQLHIP